MVGINGTAMLIVGGIWIATVVVLLLSMSAARRVESSPRRERLLAVADEFLALARQAEVTTESGEGELEQTRRRAAVMLELLRTELAADSMALHHAEAMLTTLTNSAADQRETGPRIDYHRSMFADAIWRNIDPAPKRLRVMHRSAVRQKLHHVTHSHFWHR
jgi:hypothetical protein